MGLPIHDVTSSTVNLARMILDGMDDHAEMTSVRTATLKLLLNTLINLGTPRHHDKLVDSSTRTVSDMMRQISDVTNPMPGSREGGPLGRL